LNCVAIFINPLREKVGVMFGNPETTPGGRALKFYSSVRIDIRKIEPIKVNGEVIGSRTRAKVVKNKIAPPFREAEFDIMYGKGISRVGELLDLAVKLDIVKKSGSWFSYNGTRIGQGRDNTKEYLLNNPEIAKQVEDELMANKDKITFSKSVSKTRAKATPVKDETPDEAPNTDEQTADSAEKAESRTSDADIDIMVE
ncbi:MAG: DNA recombination/repair protein RecA, partial [Acutalibacteraceae bacterium]